MKLALWLIQRGVPAPWRESVLGDLAEEAARRRRAGRTVGSWWAVPAAVAIVTRFRLEQRASDDRVGRVTWLSGWGVDLRHAVRTLRSSPGFTAVAVAVLALGVGATTAVFTVVDVSLLRPLPFPDSDRLVAVGEVNRLRPVNIPGYVGSTAVQNFRDWQDQQTVFSALAAAANAGGFTIRDNGAPERLQALRATANLLDVLRVRPLLGGAFVAAHEEPGQGAVALIGYDFWHRRFNGDPEVVGKTLSFDSGVYEVIGVLPQGFRYPVQLDRPTDLMVPMERTEQDRVRDRTRVGRNYFLRAVGRLQDGVSLEQAQSQFSQLTEGLAASYPDWFEDQMLAMAPLHLSVVGRTRDWMLMLLGAVGLVLLIACTYVANLLLARASERAREVQVRAALGASRWRLIRGAMTESVLLSVMGLAAAILVAIWGVAVLGASMPVSVPRVAALAVDGRVLVFASMVALGTGAACGWFPAWQLTRRSRVQALHVAGRGDTAGRGRQRLRAVLVVAEVAVAAMLVVAAGLFVSSLVRVMNVDLGMDIRNVLAVPVSLRITTSDRADMEGASQRAWEQVEQVMARLREAPGVVGVAAVGSGSPLSGSWRTNAITVPGQPTFFSDADQVQIKEVTPGYRDVLRVTLRQGRYIEATDTAGAEPVVVLNEEAVRRFFDGRQPVGTIVELDDVQRRVIGVVADVRVRGPEVPQAPEAYLPIAQRRGFGATVLVRTSGDARALVPFARDATLAVVPDVPVSLETLEDALRAMTTQRRFNMQLIGLFGLLAMTIAAVGIYGVMSFLVGQQRREIGVRLALGAQRTGILGLVLGRAGAYIAAGLAVGLVAAWMLAGSLEAFLFDVRGRDLAVFASATLVLGLIGLVAAAVPALRASRVDPVTALRCD